MNRIKRMIFIFTLLVCWGKPLFAIEIEHGDKTLTHATSNFTIANSIWVTNESHRVTFNDENDVNYLLISDIDVPGSLVVTSPITSKWSSIEIYELLPVGASRYRSTHAKTIKAPVLVGTYYIDSPRELLVETRFTNDSDPYVSFDFFPDNDSGGCINISPPQSNWTCDQSWLPAHYRKEIEPWISGQLSEIKYRLGQVVIEKEIKDNQYLAFDTGIDMVLTCTSPSAAISVSRKKYGQVAAAGMIEDGGDEQLAFALDQLNQHLIVIGDLVSSWGMEPNDWVSVVQQLSSDVSSIKNNIVGIFELDKLEERFNETRIVWAVLKSLLRDNYGDWSKLAINAGLDPGNHNTIDIINGFAKKLGYENTFLDTKYDPEKANSILLNGLDLGDWVYQRKRMPNPFNDVDGDGIVNAEDDEPNINCSDRDSDGLPDSWELSYVQNLAELSPDGDYDSDGVTDIQEYILGSDPTKIPEENAIQSLSTGADHSCALVNGQVRCWGRNDYGQIDVPDLSNPTDVIVGYEYSCAMDDNGVTCWGRISEAPSLSNPVKVTPGGRYVCAIHDDGVKCWGENSYGVLNAPSMSDPTDVGAGIYTACAIDNGKVRCWGATWDGWLADPPNQNIRNAKSIAMTWGIACVLDDSGVICWGSGISQPNPWDNINPGKRVSGLVNPKSIEASGGGMVCALDDEGIKCWGSGCSASLVTPLMPIEGPVQLSTGYGNCVFSADGISCWESGSKPGNTHDIGYGIPGDLVSGPYRNIVIATENRDELSSNGTWLNWYNEEESPEKILKFISVGNQAVTINNISDPAAPFLLNNFTPSELQPGESLFLRVLFSPDVLGENFNSEFHIETDAHLNPLYKVSLSGAFPIPTVQNLQVPLTDDNGRYTISWDAVDLSDVYYVLMESDLGGGEVNVSEIYSGTDTQVELMRPDGVYGYAVRACNSSSCGYDTFSENSVHVYDKKPVITLNGKKEVVVECGAPYLEQGAVAKDDRDGDISADIQISGHVEVNVGGQYTLTYTVIDRAGNAATPVTRVVSVKDCVAPVVTPPADLLVAAIDANGIETSHNIITSFLSAASANDDVDGTIENTSHNAPASFPLGMTTVTFSATDKAGNTGIGEATVTVTDQTEPVVTVPSDITVSAYDASGTLATNGVISALLSGASAQDNVDGKIEIINNDAPIIFPLGVTAVTFHATDKAGNTGTAEAKVTIADQTAPVVSPPSDIVVGADDAVGATASNGSISAFLSGANVTENVDTQIVVTNDAPVTFPIGTTTVNFRSVDSAGNIGEANAKVTVVKKEVLTRDVSIATMQGGQLVTTIFKGRGNVVIATVVNDRGMHDSYRYDWSGSDSVFVPVDMQKNESSILIDPSSLSVGLYLIQVSVTADGTDYLVGSSDVLVRVLSDIPAMSEENDTDGDGLSDAEEGLSDSDMDRIPDYRDASDTPNHLPADTKGAIIQADTGMNLILGDTSFVSGNSSAAVSFEDLAEHGGSGGGVGSNTEVTEYEFPCGLFDFEVSGAVTGDSVRVVIPQSSAIPEHAVYRKYGSDMGWSDFVENEKNGISSAPGVMGACPAPGDESYMQGLTEGHYCVQLTIEDGGQNDSDGLANGVVKDPGGVAVQLNNSSSSTDNSVIQPTPSVNDAGSSGGGGGGGCFIDSAQF